MSTSIAGSRPYVTNLVPSSSGKATQSTPSTVRQSAVVGAGVATPHRATTAGSPQARTAGAAGSVDTGCRPETEAGQAPAARAHAGSAPRSGTPTATER